ncbi:MAG: hypothetical protein HC905_17890 [Bacteroidales bacterium]|nr:hypothetical protein [Bacteroidales bacterium]
MGIFLTAIMLMSCSKSQKEWSVTSPSGQIKFSLSLGQNNQLFYQVFTGDSSSGKPVILSSPLGIKRSDQSFTENLKFVSTEPVKTFSESFTLPLGKQKSLTNTGNELVITFENESGIQNPGYCTSLR